MILIEIPIYQFGQDNHFFPRSTLFEFTRQNFSTFAPSFGLGIFSYVVSVFQPPLFLTLILAFSNFQEKSPHFPTFEKNSRKQNFFSSQKTSTSSGIHFSLNSLVCEPSHKSKHQFEIVCIGILSRVRWQLLWFLIFCESLSWG